MGPTERFSPDESTQHSVGLMAKAAGLLGSLPSFRPRKKKEFTNYDFRDLIGLRTDKAAKL